MSRTVVYPQGEPGSRAGAVAGDTYEDKLLKYVPVEVVAFYAVVYASVQREADWLKWFILLLGVFGTVGYLVARSDRSRPPRWYFYVLSVIAFLAWALGTSSVGQDLFAFPDAAAKIMLPSGVFIVPLVDELLTRRAMPSPTT